MGQLCDAVTTRTASAANTSISSSKLIKTSLSPSPVVTDLHTAHCWSSATGTIRLNSEKSDVLAHLTPGPGLVSKILLTYGQATPRLSSSPSSRCDCWLCWAELGVRSKIQAAQWGKCEIFPWQIAWLWTETVRIPAKCNIYLVVAAVQCTVYNQCTLYSADRTALNW